MADEEEVEINHYTRASEIVSVFRAVTGGQNKHMGNAWAVLFDAKVSSDEYYIALGAVSRSLAALRDEIEESSLRDTSKQMYLGAADTFQKYIEVMTLKSLTTDQLKAETDSFRLLTLLDDVLKPSANRDMPKATLKAWIASVDELIESAGDAIDNATLKAFVVRQLHHLRWAIGNYQFIGIDGISRAYGSMAAEIARSQNMQGGQTDSARSWFKKAKKPIIAIGVAIAASSAVVEQADKLIEHGGNVYEAITHHGVDSQTPEKARSEGNR